MYCIGSFLYFWSVYVGFFFIGSFSSNVLGNDQTTGINMLSVINGVEIPGRLIPAYVAQVWTGPLNFMIPNVASAAILLYSWNAVKSTTALWIWAGFYGFAAAGLQALHPVVLAALTVDPKKIGVRTGMCFSIVVSFFGIVAAEMESEHQLRGVAVLTGPPIAGALIQQGGGSFLGLQLFAATAMTVFRNGARLR